jgi:hypothetical protein
MNEPIFSILFVLGCMLITGGACIAWVFYCEKKGEENGSKK